MGMDSTDALLVQIPGTRRGSCSAEASKVLKERHPKSERRADEKASLSEERLSLPRRPSEEQVIRATTREDVAVDLCMRKEMSCDSSSSNSSVTRHSSALYSRRRLSTMLPGVSWHSEGTPGNFSRQVSEPSARLLDGNETSHSPDQQATGIGYSPRSPGSPSSPCSPSSPTSRLFERRRLRLNVTGTRQAAQGGDSPKPLQIDTLNLASSPSSLQIDTASANHEERRLLEGDAIGRFADNYYDIEVLGQGSTGVVYRARHRDDKRLVALKTVRTDDEELIRIAEREYAVLSTIQHPSIIRALDFFIAADRIVLVLEFFEGMSLTKAVADAPGRMFSERSSHHLFVKLLQAVAHLHQHRVIHRDVKADNILVAKDLQELRLIDFNTAKRLAEGGALTVTGTRLYGAPEVLLGDSPSEGSDVWAVGLCLHIMLSGHLPSQLRRPVENFDAFVRRVVDEPFSLDGRRWKHISQSCKATLLRCLEKDRNLRPAAMTLLEEDWIRDGPESRSKSPKLNRRNSTCCYEVARRQSGSFLSSAAASRRQNGRKKRANSC